MAIPLARHARVSERKRNASAVPLDNDANLRQIQIETCVPLPRFPETSTLYVSLRRSSERTTPYAFSTTTERFSSDKAQVVLAMSSTCSAKTAAKDSSESSFLCEARPTTVHRRSANDTCSLSADTRTWRRRFSFRRKLVLNRTRAQRGVRDLFRSQETKAPRGTKLWTKKEFAGLAS